MSQNNKSEILEDYLENDQQIPGQNFVCLSFVSPESIIEKKEVFYMNEFFKKTCEEMGINKNDALNYLKKYEDFKFGNKDTLDNYMIHSEIYEEEWKAILMQVIMMLLTYQKTFEFTHNDLHTNNVMYIETKKEFIYYRYNNIYYKVPTYNKIWKLIDFGRAIYRYKGNIICRVVKKEKKEK